MIDTDKAKRLRDQAVRLARSEGRISGNIETKAGLRRIVQYERGRIAIEYIAPRYPDAPRIKTARPCAYTILLRFNGAKVLGVAWDETRTSVPIFRPGSWEDRLQFEGS
jgi:hypothetical protein